MKLLTKKIEADLRKNSKLAGEFIEKDETFNPKPVVKLFTPWGGGTWLLTELDEDGRLFGLCDLGMGEPELGYVMLSELEELRGPAGLKVERDCWFKPEKTLDAYVEDARAAGRILV